MSIEQIKYYQEQIHKFEHVLFEPNGHIYEINGKTAQSVTSILKQYVLPFKHEYWAETKAKQLGIVVEEILDKWQYNSQLACTKGSIVHSYLESLLSGRSFVYPDESIIAIFGHDPIQEPFTQIVMVIQQFISDIQDKMLPIASELIIGDAQYLVGGTIDQLFYNKKSNQLEIWDWKTNKEIRLKSRYFHLYELGHIPDTELDRYSLQLSLYKLILERNTALKLGDSYIVWFNENQPKYQILKARDYNLEAQIILDKVGL